MSDEQPGAAEPAEERAPIEERAAGEAPLEPQGEGPAAPAEEEKKKRSFLTELPVLILIAFALAVLIKTFLLQAFYIPSESMEPTLLVGDRVLVNKLVYRVHPPRRGDVIVFIEKHGEQHRSFLGKVKSVLFEGLGVTKPKDTDFIKRVIGLPGETVTVRDAKVTITRTDGTKITLDEPYISSELDTTPFGPHKIAAGHYFVMGDNRANSADSRTELGDIKRSDIVGRAFIRMWPFRRMGILHRPKYPDVSAFPLPGVAPPRPRVVAAGPGAILAA